MVWQQSLESEEAWRALFQSAHGLSELRAAYIHAVFEMRGGDVSATARGLDIMRQTVRDNLVRSAADPATVQQVKPLSRLTLQEFLDAYIQYVVDHTKNVSAAIRHLKIPRSTFYKQRKRRETAAEALKVRAEVQEG